MNETNNKFHGLQLARGIAAVLVTLYHTSNHLRLDFGYLPMQGIFHFGRSGVDFFFVLSGFIICFVHANDIGNRSRIGHYITRRLTRIYPMLWIVASMYLALSLITDKPPEIAQLVMEATLLPITTITIISTAWTLQYEIIFYGIFCLAILSRRIWEIALPIWITGIIFFSLQAMPQQYPAWLKMLFSIWNIEFLLGMSAAFILSHYRIAWPKMLFTFALVGFVLAGYYENIDALKGSAPVARLIYGPLSMALIIGIVGWEKSSQFMLPSALTAIGESSYSLYLTHSLTISITYKILERLELARALPYDLVFIILIVCAVTIGIITSLLLEMPAMKLVNKMVFNAKKLLPLPGPGAVK
jgi:peptidoglycan/LPS O-acetylase OafA/YrhL